MTLAALARSYVPLFLQAGERWQLDPSLLLAIAAKESAFNPAAYNPEKDNNPSRGLMQIRESTARALGYRASVAGLFDPATSIELGARLLRENIDRVRGANPFLSARETEDRAISAYNAGWSAQRAGDALRTSSGEFVNLVGYVKPVRALQLLLRSVLPAGIGALALALAVGLAWLAHQDTTKTTGRTR